MTAPLKQFFANITKTVGASGIQFVITLCTTPIMTRLFAPAAYATFGIVNTTATVIVGLGLLSLPNAYCAEKIAEVRREIIETMLLLLVGLVALAAVIAVALAAMDASPTRLDLPQAALILLPVLVLTYGVRQVMVAMAIQRASFNRLPLSQVIEPVFSRGGSIALGATLGGNPAFILLAVALGHLSTIAVLFRLVPSRVHAQWHQVIAHLPHLIVNLRRYGDFVVFGTLSQQAQQVVMLGLQLAIATYFSKDLAGQYILAVSILTLPVTLISLATAPVVYHHFIETEKHAPARLPRHFLLAAALYLLGGAVILLPVALFGEELFGLAFGGVWMHAGRIASLLSIAYVGTFVLTGVQSVFMVTRRLKLQFLLEAGSALPILLIAVFSFKSMAFDQAILVLSLVWLLRNFMLFLAALTAALQHAKPPP